MVSIVATLASPQNLPVGALVLVVTAIFLIVLSNLNRPPLPHGVPWIDKGWPIIGSVGFFTKRGEFLNQGAKKSSSGHFGFYYGSRPIVALSGEAGRAAFFTCRGLDLNGGFKGLAAAGPNLGHLIEHDADTYFRRNLKQFTSREHLRNVLRHFNSDISTAYRGIETTVPLSPFDFMYNLVYQMTHRAVGAHDIADDPALLKKTLKMYQGIDQVSPLRIMFPSLITPSRLYQMWCGGGMITILRKIMKDRKTTGKRQDDALQWMMDNGDKDIAICVFIIGALFAGLSNTGVQAAWILCYLAKDPYWYAQVQAEVDKAITKHRVSANETPADILQRFSVEDWETEFPIIDLALRESIRINSPATSLRQNNTGKDVIIGDTGVVVPKYAYAVYGQDDTHMNESLYKEPLKWDPSRYLPDRAEDQKQKHGYVGWGTGLHPCLGMRMAKLEIANVTATFVASFDFKLVDKKGNPFTKPLRSYDANRLTVTTGPKDVYLKCTPRC